MARLPYDAFPDVDPSGAPGGDYISAEPLAGRARQQLGQSLEQAGQQTADVAIQQAQFYGKIASTDAYNKMQSFALTQAFGDGTANNPGFLSLKGADAMRAYPGFQQQLNDTREQIRSGLQSREAQLEFDQDSRRLVAYYTEQAGRHYADQLDEYGVDTNTATLANSVRSAGVNWNDDTAFDNAITGAVRATTRIGLIKGWGNDFLDDQLDTARSKVVESRVLGMSTHDPQAALAFLHGHESLVDAATYDDLSSKLQDKADRQAGLDFSTSFLSGRQATTAAAAATSFANPSQPIYRQTASDIAGGMSPGGLARTVQIESGGNAGASNPSGHVGLGQFDEATWARYGQGDRTNPNASIMAIQRYAAANSKYLAPILGRPPTDSELYLAHQQGPRGASLLLTNPDELASNLIGPQAVIENGGTADMTAAQFTSMVTHKFNGTVPLKTYSVSQATAQRIPFVESTSGPPLANAPATSTPQTSGSSQSSVKADAYQAIEASDLSPQAKQYAYDSVNRQLTAQQIADESNAAAIKLRSDHAAGTYMTQILTPGSNLGGMAVQIAQDPNLEWQTKEALTSALQAHAESSASGATAAFGSGFWSAYQQVVAPAGDPSRIADASAILRRAGPGGDLTLAGAQRLITVMSQSARSVDDAAVNQTKAGLLAYAKSKVSFDTSGMPLAPGEAPRRDAEGEMLFNARFVPQFEAAFDQWVKAGKDPWQFLTQDNVDKLAARLRSPREMALAKLEAQNTGLDASQLSAPPAPAGVNEEGWKLVMNAPAQYNGKSLPDAKWQGVVQTLQQNPTPRVRKWFDLHFAGSGITADDIRTCWVSRPRTRRRPQKRNLRPLSRQRRLRPFHPHRRRPRRWEWWGGTISDV
jgi:hypothetical protein